MSESGQRQRVIKALKTLHAIPVENPMRPGTPDVNYADGWIELKWKRSWPKKPESIVQLPHFTPWQRRWLKKRYEISRAGACWLLLQVGREWMLFTGRDAADYVGLVGREGLYKVARVRWTSGLKDKELIECLTRDWANWDGSPVVNSS